ncbi:hypothetical protein, partial [Aeromonas salmonicida]|uniref:hypothetical protein n=1 Tax=Aeromonas salmonicida TaxID=645 RepID=UPI003D19E8F6
MHDQPPHTLQLFNILLTLVDMGCSLIINTVMLLAGLAITPNNHPLPYGLSLSLHDLSVNRAQTKTAALGCVLKMLVFCPPIVPVSNEGRKPA